MESNILEILQLLKEGQERIETRLDSIESQVYENTQLLKALEHKVDIIKVEQENMKHDVANIRGDFKTIKNDMINLAMMTVNNLT